MSLPNLRDYYYAGQLKTKAFWSDNQYEAEWKELEMERKGVPVQASIGDHKLVLAYQHCLNAITSITLHTWFDVVCLPSLKNRWVTLDTK